MNNLVTLCTVLAIVVYFVNGYDFQDSYFNQILSSNLEDALDSLDAISQHVRSRRDEEASVAMDDKCKKRHRRPKLCCADESFDAMHDKDKDIFRGCLKDTLGVEKLDHHHRKLDLFNCEEVEKRKNEMICVQQCIGQKKNLLKEDGSPNPKEITKYIKESLAKETWIEAVVDKITSTCITEAKNATVSQVKPTSNDVKVCNPSAMTLKHCLFKEIQLSCPADQIKDKSACDKFQERIKKGFDFYGPPPPPPFDGSKDD
nr:odorant binding protein 26 [Pachyrhinus yasumatsui]